MKPRNKFLPDSIPILGIPVTPFKSYEDAVKSVRDRIHHGHKTICMAVNPDKIYQAKRDPKLKAILDSANIRICDGIGVVFAAWFLNRKRIFRCTGIDLFSKLLRTSIQEEWKVFLLGASPESNEGTYNKIIEQYPNLQIVGRHDGYFKDSEEIIKDINSSGADLLFVAMGSPRQEIWMIENFQRLNISFCMGLGGTFDVISGATKRAPRIFRRTGTEFIYRLLSNPGWKNKVRLKRGLIRILFILYVLKEKLA